MFTEHFKEYSELTAAQFPILFFLLISAGGLVYFTCYLAVKYLVNATFHRQGIPLISFRQRVFNPGLNGGTQAKAARILQILKKSQPYIVQEIF